MANPPPIEPLDFALAANKEAGSVDITLEAVAGPQVVRLPAPEAMELASMILATLPHVPYPELSDDLQQFALREIEAQEASGAIFLTYGLENGMAFASAPRRERLEALHQQLGELLAKLPGANIIPGPGTH